MMTCFLVSHAFHKSYYNGRCQKLEQTLLKFKKFNFVIIFLHAFVLKNNKLNYCIVKQKCLDLMATICIKWEVVWCGSNLLQAIFVWNCYYGSIVIEKYWSVHDVQHFVIWRVGIFGNGTIREVQTIATSCQA